MYPANSAASAGDSQEDMLDPETLYTKQNCIGMFPRALTTLMLGVYLLTTVQEEAVLAKSTKGAFPHIVFRMLTNTRVDKRTGQAVAIKIIDVENAEDEVDDIISEISILSELNSPYVTKYYGSFLKGSDLWIVMEFCSGGSCADLMRPGLISEEYISIIVRELLMGLEYLHGDNKLHRDIKGRSMFSWERC
jgi:serine/threonine protein kinase